MSVGSFMAAMLFIPDLAAAPVPCSRLTCQLPLAACPDIYGADWTHWSARKVTEGKRATRWSIYGRLWLLHSCPPAVHHLFVTTCASLELAGQVWSHGSSWRSLDCAMAGMSFLDPGRGSGMVGCSRLTGVPDSPLSTAALRTGIFGSVQSKALPLWPPESRFFCRDQTLMLLGRF